MSIRKELKVFNLPHREGGSFIATVRALRENVMVFDAPELWFVYLGEAP